MGFIPVCPQQAGSLRGFQQVLRRRDGKDYWGNPVSDEHVDFVIIGRRCGLQGWRKNRNPHNGFVLSLPLEELEPGEFEPVVRYRFAKGGNFVEVFIAVLTCSGRPDHSQR